MTDPGITVHWADVIAQKLEDSGPHTIATGITPSGPVHIGNMREVMTADAVSAPCWTEGSRPASST